MALITTVTERTGRVATHGLRGELLVRQAESVGLPLTRVRLPPSPSNGAYERAMASTLRSFRARGIRLVVFGDLFLEDIRRYRERQLAALGMEAIFPLWGRDTAGLAREMIHAGVRARLVAVDSRRLPGSWAGRPFDERLIRELPPQVDPCGENGEFHTFVTAGPMLQHPVPVSVRSVTDRNGTARADLRPSSPVPSARGGPTRARPIRDKT